MEVNIGAVIFGLRRKKGMTQEQLAESVGVSPPAVSKWETGASCPDVALLAPIARALDTDVNTLLSFSPTLSREELPALVRELQQLSKSGGAAALARMRELVHRYPSDPQLRFQLSSIAMGFPSLWGWSEAETAEAQDFAEQGFEFVRQHGERTQWPTVTYMLAGLLLSKGQLDRAEALLDSLPVMPLSPQALYAALYQKRGDGDKARAAARSQLASGATAVLNSLLVLASPDCAASEDEALPVLRAYRTVADALGYPTSQTELLLLSRELRQGRTEQALDRLVKAAHSLTEEVPHLLWDQPGDRDADHSDFRRQMGVILRHSLLADPAFDAVRQDPRYLEALRILDPEA